MHEAAGVAGASVVDDRLETVADFDAGLAIGGSDEEEDSAIFLLGADAELRVEIVGVLFDGFVFEGADGDDSHLSAGFLFELEAETFEAGFAIGVDDADKVGDVASGVNVLDLSADAASAVAKERKMRRNGDARDRAAKEMRLKGTNGMHL